MEHDDTAPEIIVASPLATKSLSIKSKDDTTVTVAGYGLVFGDEDLYGDTFAPDTDFDIDLVPHKPVYYDHALQAEVKHRLGKVTSVKADEVGLWIEAQLDRSQAYVEEVLKLIDQGVMGWSSGSVPHLVRRDASVIKSWPIVEFSLTPTPAEPRTLGVFHKSSTVTPQAALQASGDDANEPATDATPLSSPSSTSEGHSNPMEENEKTEQSVDVAAIAKEAAKEAATEAVKAFQAAQPVIHTAGFVAPGVDTGTKHEAEAIKSFGTYVRTGDRSAVKAALNEGTAGQGGYLVPTKYSNELISSLKDASILRQAGARTISVDGTTAFKMAARNDTNAAVLTSEGAQFEELEPTFSEITFTPYKYTRLVKASDEVLADSRFDVVSQVILPDVSQAYAAAENAVFTSGTGSGQPQGIVAGASAGVTAASATAITADEILDLYHSLSYLYRQNAVFLMNDATIKLVRKLKDSDGQYLWQPGMQAGQPDRLLGRPVYTLNSMATPAASAKTIVFADLRSSFIIADFAGLEMKRLEELYAATGQVGFRWFKRFDSRVVLSSAAKVLTQAAS